MSCETFCIKIETRPTSGDQDIELSRPRRDPDVRKMAWDQNVPRPRLHTWVGGAMLTGSSGMLTEPGQTCRRRALGRGKVTLHDSHTMALGMEIYWKHRHIQYTKKHYLNYIYYNTTSSAPVVWQFSDSGYSLGLVKVIRHKMAAHDQPGFHPHRSRPWDYRQAPTKAIMSLPCDSERPFVQGFPL